MPLARQVYRAADTVGPKPKPTSPDSKRYTHFSADCKAGRHHKCIAKKCECECGHVTA